MERRVPPSERKIAGATLTVSTNGGFSVTHNRDYIGYLHASVGDQFRVYRRMINEMDIFLGRFNLEDGVRAILHASGRPILEEAV
jgi:hypothetical protein